MHASLLWDVGLTTTPTLSRYIIHLIANHQVTSQQINDLFPVSKNSCICDIN